MDSVKPIKIIMTLVTVVILVLLVLILMKVDKKCKGSGNSNSSMRNMMMGRKVGDLGPPAAGNRVLGLPPGSPFVKNCLAQFQQGVSSTQSVCGDAGGDIAVTDFTDPNDFNCEGMPYIAYQQSDCTAPLAGMPSGYLCGGNNCPIGVGSSGTVGTAPPNPWGCTSICP